MDQAAEQFPPLDLWHDLHRLEVVVLLRCSKVNAAVGSLGVVVPGVARENAVQMTATEDQGPVENLMAEGLHDALGKGIVMSLQLQMVLKLRGASLSPIPSIP